jgi:hypothetical protein
VSALHAARVAARLKRELGSDVEMIHGHYGEFKILVDGNVVVDAGLMAVLGIVPPDETIVDAVRKVLSSKAG